MGNPNQPTGPIPIVPPPKDMMVRRLNAVAFVLVVIAAGAGFMDRAMLAGGFAAATAVVLVIALAVLRPPKRRG